MKDDGVNFTLDERAIIGQLQDWTNDKTFSPQECWQIFSYPKLVTIFATMMCELTLDEVKSLRSAKSKLRSLLEKRSNYRCAYCRRLKTQHEYAWHVEHVKNKNLHRDLTFKIGNLAHACVECNFTKNINIDSKNPYTFDIIHPAEDGFQYSDHMLMMQVMTESVAYLQYAPGSPEAFATYYKLNFELLERNAFTADFDPDLHKFTADLANSIEIAKVNGMLEIAGFMSEMLGLLLLMK